MSKMPPNPYDIGPPDPEVLPCEICYGTNGHMPTQAPVEPYGEVFYKSMQHAVAVESPIQPVPGVPF